MSNAPPISFSYGSSIELNFFLHSYVWLKTIKVSGCYMKLVSKERDLLEQDVKALRPPKRSVFGEFLQQRTIKIFNHVEMKIKMFRNWDAETHLQRWIINLSVKWILKFMIRCLFWRETHAMTKEMENFYCTFSCGMRSWRN